MKPVSKSSFLKGIQCEKSLYLSIHFPKLADPITERQQAIFDQGHEVQLEVEKRLFPGIHKLDLPPWKIHESIQASLEALEKYKTIGEATFSRMLGTERLTARVDIVEVIDQKKIKIIEVKSTTKVKPEHYMDLAFQAWIALGAGFEVVSCELIHINSECVFPNLENLFVRQDLSEKVKQTLGEIEAKANLFLNTLKQPEIPNVNVGAYCENPNPCSFLGHCWQKIQRNSVLNLPKKYFNVWDLFSEGIVSVESISESELEGDLSKKIINAVKTNTRWVDRTEIKKEIRDWKKPFHHLDFETLGFAIPKHKGAHPYQQIPFQFSCIVESDNSRTHFEFLSDSFFDEPMKDLLERLKTCIQKEGSIIAYNSNFEAAVLRLIAEALPDEKDLIESWIQRLVDPLPVFRRAVYDPGFEGSYSIKAVAPAILGETHSYVGLEVRDGEQAQRAYLEYLHTKDVKIKKALLEYCHQDTEVMALLVKWLFEQ
ncbi:MAG: DUF2779 domain-containing protein [Bacteriovoracia bacterium]